MSTEEKKLFARVKLMPSGVWVCLADAPIDYPLGRVYTKFSICFREHLGTIYTLERAIEIRNTVSRVFTAAALEPATCEEWVTQEAEPAEVHHKG